MPPGKTALQSSDCSQSQSSGEERWRGRAMLTQIPGKEDGSLGLHSLLKSVPCRDGLPVDVLMDRRSHQRAVSDPSLLFQFSETAPVSTHCLSTCPLLLLLHGSCLQEALPAPGNLPPCPRPSPDSFFNDEDKYTPASHLHPTYIVLHALSLQPGPPAHSGRMQTTLPLVRGK